MVEDLTISNMIRNKYLARSISDASWGLFISYLQYKAENAGTQLIKVDPRNTSKLCSNCNRLKEKRFLPLSQREYNCPCCGLVLDRDHNAAINILTRGLIQEGIPDFERYIPMGNGKFTLGESNSTHEPRSHSAD